MLNIKMNVHFNIQQERFQLVSLKFLHLSQRKYERGQGCDPFASPMIFRKK